MRTFKLSAIAFTISSLLTTGSAYSVIHNTDGLFDVGSGGVISGSGVIEADKIYNIISTVGQKNNISIANNGSITVMHDGGSPLVPAWGEFDQGDFALTNGSVVVFNSGTINLGSGSTVNTKYTDLIEGVFPSRPDLPLDMDYNFVFGVGISVPGGTSEEKQLEQGKIIANDLTINMSHQRDNKRVMGLHASKDNGTLELSGLTTINTTAQGNNSNAWGIYVRKGALVNSEDFNILSKGQSSAIGILANSTYDHAQTQVRYNNASIKSYSEEFAAGIVIGSGDVTALGDTNLDINVTNAGGIGEGIELNYGGEADDSSLRSTFNATGDTNISLKSGADDIVLSGAMSTGASELTANNLSITFDTQGQQKIEGTGLFASTDSTGKQEGTGKITIKGDLDIDSSDINHNGSWRYVVAENGGDITLDGKVRLGVKNNDPDAIALLSEKKGSQITTTGKNLHVVGTIVSRESGLVNIHASDESRFIGGFITSSEGVSSLALSDNSEWTMTKDSQLTNLTLNNSSLSFMHAGLQTNNASTNVAGFKTLLVESNFAGSDGNLVMNTALGDDNSLTDRLIVNGDTSGTTNVKVINAGGKGELTSNGIELITVKGRSEGEFIQNGRIVAGSYDYMLQRGTGTNSVNWYLSSALSPLTPEVTNPPLPVNPEEPDSETDGEPGVPWPEAPESTKPNPEIKHAVRPEAGLYGINLAAANTLFNTRLHDRMGDTSYVDSLTGKKASTNLWMRNIGGHTRQRDNSGQLKLQSNRYVMQLGGDVAQWSSNSDDRFHLGVMGGYANQKSSSINEHTNYRASSRINGYSLGVYGTWLQYNETKEGAYIDIWAQYNWFDNTIFGEDIAAEKYKSKGLTASVESGYTLKLSDISERNAMFIQPKIQLTWMGVKSDSHTEANGTKVEGKGDGNIQTRVGLRLYSKGHNKLDDGKDREFQPFVEANWINDSKSFGTSLNGDSVNLVGNKNTGEIKAGVVGQINNNLSVWGNVSQKIGDKGYSDTQGILGVRYSW